MCRLGPSNRSRAKVQWARQAAESEKGSKELHIVYASPGAVVAYRQTGRFPNGAVLVKELFHAATGQMTTGTVSRADSLKGWFVARQRG